MPKTAQFAEDLEKLIMQATAIANIADNAASSPATNYYVSLHTSSPGTGGDQTTNEISYTGYARIAVARTSGGWTITSGVVNPTSPITFGTMTAGAGGTVTYIGIGKASSGTGYLMYFFPVSPSLTVVNGVQPILDATSAFNEQ
jgi:hypothetical protein